MNRLKNCCNRIFYSSLLEYYQPFWLSPSDVITIPVSQWRDYYPRIPQSTALWTFALRRRPNGRCLIALVVVVDRLHIALFSDFDADSVRSYSMWFWMIYCRHSSSPLRTIISVATRVAMPLRSMAMRLFLGGGEGEGRGLLTAVWSRIRTWDFWILSSIPKLQVLQLSLIHIWRCRRWP